MDLDLLVIGDSSAGWQGAVAAAQRGYQVGLIAPCGSSDTSTSDLRQISSTVLDDAYADWPRSRTVKHAALRRAASAPWIQFADNLKATWRSEIGRYRHQHLVAGGQIWTGSAAFTGIHSVHIDAPGSASVELSAQHTLIATGTQSQRPPFASGDFPGVFDAARLLDASALPKAASIVGAGVTGLRAACLLAWWGVHVRVLDSRSSQSLLHDDEASDLLLQAEGLGVTFDLSEDVIGLQSAAGRRVMITFESGRRAEADSVWLATGRRGRTDELQLECAELSTDDCGRLWCGAQLRTWTASICAVGDVVGYSPETGSESELVSQAVHALLGNVVKDSRSLRNAHTIQV
ncbi:MAG: FAD-dependent oxidoreductase [Planctomycetota bacterium]